MILKVKKQIGNDVLEVEIDERDEKEALARAVFFLEPDYCHVCKGRAVKWGAHKSKDDKGQTFTYIDRTCLGCFARSTAGSYQTGGLFWKKFEERVAKTGDTVVVPDNEG